MITKPYLEHINSKFPKIGKGVKLQLAAEESALKDKNSGFNMGAKEENYSDVYKWETTTHPYFNKYDSWYSIGEKVWPREITLTPSVLKSWYVSDGSWKQDSNHRYLRIAMNNEMGNQDKINSYFTNVGLPSPNSYNSSKWRFEATFTVKQSQTLIDYMGEAPPGFEYKWP